MCLNRDEVNTVVLLQPWFSLALKKIKIIRRKTSLQEHPVFLALFIFCTWNKRQKNGCPCRLKKSASDSTEPCAREPGAVQPEVQYFWTSNRISPGWLMLQPLARGNKDSWYKVASIPVESPTSQSTRTICDITGDFDLIWYLVLVYRPLSNFSNYDFQVWFVILDEQLYWGSVHTTLEKFENAALFLQWSLSSTIRNIMSQKWMLLKWKCSSN